MVKIQATISCVYAHSLITTALQDPSQNEEARAVRRSRAEELDSKFRELFNTTLAECGDDLFVYVAKHRMLHHDLSSLRGSELSEDFKESSLRLGLPEEVRVMATGLRLDPRITSPELRYLKFAEALMKEYSSLTQPTQAPSHRDHPNASGTKLPDAPGVLPVRIKEDPALAKNLVEEDLAEEKHK